MASGFDFDQIKSEEKPFADRLAYFIKYALRPSKVLDIGCGPGHFVESLRDLGVDSVGIDIDPIVGVDKPYLMRMSLLELTLKADTSICIEVLEHLDEKDADLAVENIAESFTDTLIFTAARPGQGGVGHINCREPDYWSSKFLARGCLRNYLMEDLVRGYSLNGYHMGWFINNVLIFNKPVKK